MPLEIAAAIGEPSAKRFGCHWFSFGVRYYASPRETSPALSGSPSGWSALTAPPGEPLRLLLVALDLLGQLVDGIGIELFRLLDQLLSLLVALDEAIETLLGQIAGAFAFVCHWRLPSPDYGPQREGGEGAVPEPQRKRGMTSWHKRRIAFSTAVMRYQPAAVQLGENPVEADLVAQPLQLGGDAVRGPDQHVAAQRVVISQGAQAARRGR